MFDRLIEWENTLMEMERGNADADAFLSGIVRMTVDLVKAYPFLSDAEVLFFWRRGYKSAGLGRFRENG